MHDSDSGIALEEVTAVVINVIGSLFMALLAILAVGVASAMALGLATLLTLVFRVSVFEASLVVLGVVAGAAWFISTVVASREIEVEEEVEPAEEIQRWLESVPLPPARGGKRKRH